MGSICGSVQGGEETPISGGSRANGPCCHDYNAPEKTWPTAETEI